MNTHNIDICAFSIKGKRHISKLHLLLQRKKTIENNRTVIGTLAQQKFKNIIDKLT
jgi:hypothetical protein